MRELTLTDAKTMSEDLQITAASNDAEKNSAAQNVADQENVERIFGYFIDTFRCLKYGVLEKKLPADQKNNAKLSVVEAPCFNGDLHPVAEPAYFEYDDRSLVEMLRYYSKVEMLVHERFERMQVHRIVDALSELFYSVTFNEDDTQLHVVFSNEFTSYHHEGHYQVSIMHLIQLLHDLYDHNKRRAKCLDNTSYELHLANVVRPIMRKFNFASLGLETVYIPWLDHSGKIFTVRSVYGHRNLPILSGYTDDIDGICCFVTRLFQTLTQQNVRDYMSDPNTGREEA